MPRRGTRRGTPARRPTAAPAAARGKTKKRPRRRVEGEGASQQTREQRRGGAPRPLARSGGAHTQPQRRRSGSAARGFSRSRPRPCRRRTRHTRVSDAWQPPHRTQITHLPAKRVSQHLSSTGNGPVMRTQYRPAAGMRRSLCNAAAGARKKNTHQAARNEKNFFSFFSESSACTFRARSPLSCASGRPRPSPGNEPCH